MQIDKTVQRTYFTSLRKTVLPSLFSLVWLFCFDSLIISWKRSFGKVLGIFRLVVVWHRLRELRKHVWVMFELFVWECVYIFYCHWFISLEVFTWHSRPDNSRCSDVSSVRLGWHLKKLSASVFKAVYLP